MTAEAKKYAKVIESATRLQDKESRIKTIEEGLIRYASAKAEEVAVEFAAYFNDQNVLVNKEAAKDCYDEWFAQYKQSK